MNIYLKEIDDNDLLARRSFFSCDSLMLSDQNTRRSASVEWFWNK
jgi:hypothetical protein